MGVFGAFLPQKSCTDVGPIGLYEMIEKVKSK